METSLAIGAEIQVATEPRDMPQASRQGEPLPFSRRAGQGHQLLQGASCSPQSGNMSVRACPSVPEGVRLRTAPDQGIRHIRGEEAGLG